MQNWREWKIGDKVKYSWNEFAGKGSLIGLLTIQEEDHAIVEAEDMHLWLDDDTKDMFRKIS